MDGRGAPLDGWHACFSPCSPSATAIVAAAASRAAGGGSGVKTVAKCNWIPPQATQPGRQIGDTCPAGKFVPPPVTRAARHGVMWVTKKGNALDWPEPGWPPPGGHPCITDRGCCATTTSSARVMAVAARQNDDSPSSRPIQIRTTGRESSDAAFKAGLIALTAKTGETSQGVMAIIRFALDLDPRQPTQPGGPLRAVGRSAASKPQAQPRTSKPIAHKRPGRQGP